MGLFTKRQKPNPGIAAQGLEIEYDSDHECWKFQYRGMDFVCFGTFLRLPTKEQLDALLETAESLKPEMRARLEKELKGYGNLKLDDGESCLVNVEEFAATGVFIVSWSDGASWGDMAADFTIKDGAIIDEAWGD